MVSRTILRTFSLLRLRRGRVRCSTQGPPCELLRKTPALLGENVPAASSGMSTAWTTDVRCSGCTVRDTLEPPMNAADAEPVINNIAMLRAQSNENQSEFFWSPRRATLFRGLNRSPASARASLPRQLYGLRRSWLLADPVAGSVGRFARMPTTDRGHMSSSKALVSPERPPEPFLLC